MEAENTEKKPAAAGKSKIIMIVIMVVVAGAAAAAGFFISKQMQSSSSGHAAQKSDAGHGDEHGGGNGDEHGSSGGSGGAAQFIALDPAFVVNLSDEAGGRYMQVEVQLMSRDPGAKEKVELYAPILRNRLVMLFSQQKSETLLHREDKERLQAEALAEVQAALDKETGRKVVDALYFTSFVIQ